MKSVRHYKQTHKANILKRIFLSIAIFSILVNVPVSAQSLDNNPLPPGISGAVIINVYEEYGKKGFLELTLSLPDGVMKESNRGKKGFNIKHPINLYMLSSDSFGRIYESDRLYWTFMTDELKANFSQGNMEYFVRLLKTLNSKKEDSFQSKYPSTISIDKISFNRNHLKYFRPNRQFTHIIFKPADSDEPNGLLIDLIKKEVSFPFGNDLVYEYEWDKLGCRIAYSSAKKWPDAHSILVVKDICKNATLFRSDLSKRSIFDIAWESNGQYIAVLSQIFSYSYNPFALLITLGGHPVGYRTYYLDLYDIDGNRIYQSKDEDIGKFSAGRGSGLGAIVWLNRGTKLYESSTKEEQR